MIVRRGLPHACAAKAARPVSEYIAIRVKEDTSPAELVLSQDESSSPMAIPTHHPQDVAVVPNAFL
jgi:hypothetical protein